MKDLTVLLSVSLVATAPKNYEKRNVEKQRPYSNRACRIDKVRISKLFYVQNFNFEMI